MTIIKTSDKSKTRQPIIVTSANKQAPTPPKRGPGRPPKDRPSNPGTASIMTPATNGVSIPKRPPSPIAPPKAPMPTVVQDAASLTTLRSIAATLDILVKRLDTLENRVEKAAVWAAKQQSKTTNNRRTFEEICDGIAIPETDWRHEYHGCHVKLYKYELTAKGDMTVYDDEPAIDYLLAMPRDTDPGGQGSAARAALRLAAHWARAEDGAYEGQPSYLSQEELAAVWAGTQY